MPCSNYTCLFQGLILLLFYPPSEKSKHLPRRMTLSCCWPFLSFIALEELIRRKANREALLPLLAESRKYKPSRVLRKTRAEGGGRCHGDKEKTGWCQGRQGEEARRGNEESKEENIEADIKVMAKISPGKELRIILPWERELREIIPKRNPRDWSQSTGFSPNSCLTDPGTCRLSARKKIMPPGSTEEDRRVCTRASPTHSKNHCHHWCYRLFLLWKDRDFWGCLPRTEPAETHLPKSPTSSHLCIDGLDYFKSALLREPFNQ